MDEYKETEVRRWRIRNDELKLERHQNYLHQPLTEDLGAGYSNIYKLDHDLSYIETEYKPSRDLAVLSQIDNQQPRLVVTLGLKGRSRFASQQGDDVVFNEGYTSITSFNSSIGERQYEANKAILQLRFSMNRDWLSRYFDNSNLDQFFNKGAIQTLSYKPTTAQGTMLAQQLLSSHVSSDIKKLFMHGQVLSLLSSELGHLFSSQTVTKNKFTSKDKEIVYEAREILNKTFKNPPSVEQLAKRVGINQFKLKKLFHHFFNNTPYGVLLEIRMNKAYQLLESTGCHVNIAADSVGYNHASNFFFFFIKYFGVTPKSISRLKK